MSATNATETAILGLIFTATTWDNIAENDTTTPATSFWISLHTADPADSGSQTTSEAAYTGYARKQVTRDGTGWTVSGGSVTNDSDIAFGTCTSSPGGNITHVGLGLSETSTGTLLLSNPLDTAITMQVGATPIFSAGDLEFTCD